MVRNRNISVQTKQNSELCVAAEKEKKHEQETVNAHGEDSSENGLTVMGSLIILNVYRLRYLMNGEQKETLFK